MNATPENFKPGEQWLCAFDKYGTIQIREVECLRWAESSNYVKVRYFYWDNESGDRLADVSWISEMPELLERLPDESGNNQTGQTGGVEAHRGIRVYVGSKLEYVFPPAFDKEIIEVIRAWVVEQEGKADAETKA